jgi:hypothetical protein
MGKVTPDISTSTTPEACASQVSLGPAPGQARLWGFPWER